MYSNNLSPQKTNTIDIFVQITGLINPICKKMYEETDRRVDKYCRYLYTLTKLSWFFIVVPFPFISYALYFTTDLEEESFFLPFTVWYYHRTLFLLFIQISQFSNWFLLPRFPVDWRHPIIYLCPYIITSLSMIYASLICVCFLMAVVGIWLYTIASADDIYHETMELNVHIETMKNVNELNKRFYMIVELHTIIKELS